MFTRILLPVDLTDKNNQAVKVAGDLVEGKAGSVTLLHVIELIPGLSLEEEKDFYQRLDRTARAHLESLGAQLVQRGVYWQFEVRYGNRAREIVLYAKNVGSDLIVLTAPRFDPENAAVACGSLSYKLGILAPCPVLLVK